MNLFEFTNANDFLRIAQQFLEENESANNLSLGIALQVQNDPNRYVETPFFAMIMNENKQIVLTAIMTPPYPLIIQGRDGHDEQIGQLINYVLKRKLNVTGVNGRMEVSSVFANLWQIATGVDIKNRMALRVYELKKVKMPQLPAGQFRTATMEDSKTILNWFTAFQEEAMPDEDRVNNFNHIQGAITQGNVFVWEVDKQLVSMASMQRPTNHAGSVGGVYTPLAHRRKGYASACVALLSQSVLDRGYQFVNLFTDLANPTSNKIYQAIGYKPICDYHKYMFQ